MKKKIIALSAALMLFAGVVSASSINGDYKGNPIVKVTSNGKQLETDEVPAQIYDGNTLVPISLLRKFGASVTWDQNTYSVDVKLPTSNSNSDSLQSSFIELIPLSKQAGGKYFNYVFDESGSYISVRYDSVHDINKDNDSIIKLAGLSGASNAQETRILYYVDDVYSSEFVASKDDAALWITQKITDSEFTSRFKINTQVKQIKEVPQESVPPISQETINAANQAKCSMINKDYDTKIGNYRVEMGARGISKSSIETNGIKQMNSERDDKLQSLGCTTR